LTAGLAAPAPPAFLACARGTAPPDARDGFDFLRAEPDEAALFDGVLLGIFSCVSVAVSFSPLLFFL
jgi:hypothetical protein